MGIHNHKFILPLLIIKAFKSPWLYRFFIISYLLVEPKPPERVVVTFVSSVTVR